MYMQGLLERWIPYVVSGIFLLVVFIWTTYIMARTGKSLSRILTKTRNDKGMINGCSITHWVEEINRSDHYPINITRSYILRYCGHDYYFVECSNIYVTFGRFGALRGQSKAWCLIAVGKEASNVLSSNRRLFHRLTTTDMVSVFAIRRLFSFAEMLCQ